MWAPQVGPTVDPRDPQVGYVPTVGPIGPTMWVPLYVGPTEPIICGAYYSLKKTLKSNKINSHSIYVAPHKTL